MEVLGQVMFGSVSDWPEALQKTARPSSLYSPNSGFWNVVGSVASAYVPTRSPVSFGQPASETPQWTIVFANGDMAELIERSDADWLGDLVSCGSSPDFSRDFFAAMIN